jgi:hypothetical protein
MEEGDTMEERKENTKKERRIIMKRTLLYCEVAKQMEKLPHCNFSWIVSLQKQRNSVWKGLWTCHETD